jgi:hypothetical protein
MPVKYHQTMELDIHDRVRTRHFAAIQALKRLHFEEYAFFGETVQMLGFSPMGCLGVLGAFIAMFNEISSIESNLDVTVFNVTMVSREEGAYGAPFGLGVKFYTGFTDGTCIITANFASGSFRDDRSKLYKYAGAQTIESAWLNHKKQVAVFVRDGKQKMEHLSFADFEQLVQREDEYMLKNKYSLM